MWFNHTVFNRSGTRFLFPARAWNPGVEPELESAMFTANLAGSELREVFPFGRGGSRFEWRNHREIPAAFRMNGREPNPFLFTGGSAKAGSTMACT